MPGCGPAIEQSETLNDVETQMDDKSSEATPPSPVPIEDGDSTEKRAAHSEEVTSSRSETVGDVNSARVSKEKDSTNPKLDREDPKAFVRQLIRLRNIQLRYDNLLVSKSALLRAERPDQIDEFLNVDFIDERGLADENYLFAQANEYPYSKGVLDAALRSVLKTMRKKRFKTVMWPLLRRPPASDDAAQQWQRVEQLFDMPGHLASAIIGHFIWQVKQKCLGRPVVHHLMPIIFSVVQGSGKTTFVRALVGPLHELASADTLISDFADRRSGDIYRFPAIVIDDMEAVAKNDVPKLKSLVTADRINRRRLSTSQSSSMRQQATLIGTANAPVHQLIEDETGHRRFVTMPFRNGNVAKGGDADVWEVVQNLDYELLWKSVDAFGPSPIREHLSELYRYQNIGKPISLVLGWLRELDTNSEPVQVITTRFGVKADALRQLFMSQTGVEITRNKFATEMAVSMSDEKTPFGDEAHPREGKFYVLKRRSHGGGASREGLPPELLQ